MKSVKSHKDVVLNTNSYHISDIYKVMKLNAYLTLYEYILPLNIQIIYIMSGFATLFLYRLNKFYYNNFLIVIYKKQN